MLGLKSIHVDIRGPSEQIMDEKENPFYYPIAIFFKMSNI